MGPNFFQDLSLTSISNRISSLVIENVSCLNSFMEDIRMINATDVTIDGCHFDDTFSDDPGTLTASAYNVVVPNGAAFLNGTLETEGFLNIVDDPCILNMTISNTTFNNTTLKGDFTTSLVNPQFSANGAVFDRVYNTNLTNCAFNNTTNTFVDNTGETTNMLSASIENISFIDCSFDGVTSLGGINGVHISGTVFGLPPIQSARNIRFTNCTSSGHRRIGDKQLPAPTLTGFGVSGFLLFYIKDLVMEGCVASNIINNAPGSIFTANRGFNIQTSGTGTEEGQTENAVFINCISQGILANYGGSIYGHYGYVGDLSADYSSSIVYENCVATGFRATTNLLPAWVATTSYNVGSLVSFNGVNYASLISNNSNNQPDISPVAWSTDTRIVQGVAIGFATDDDFIPSINSPRIFRGCSASNIQGAPLILQDGFYPYYSSGFLINFGTKNTLDSCIATENQYGIILNGSDHCTVVNCQSDNNEIEGFTDTGFAQTTGTPAAPTQSNSLFQGNSAFNNGNGTTQVGTNGNYNVFVDPSATVPLPTLQGQLSTSTYGYFNPTIPATPVHNISIIE